MAEQMNTTTRNPAWWTEKHASDWDHVKAALERDWEQTKADFSKNGGQNLNQNAADTVKQSVGSEPIPPLGVKTHPTDPKVAAKDVEKAREHMEKESAKSTETEAKAHDEIAKKHLELNQTVGEVRKDLAAGQAKASEKLAEAHGEASDKTAEANMKASEKIAEAQKDAARGIAKGRAKIEEAGARRDEAIAKWHDAEREVRYGYSVRSQYPADYVWDDKLEGKLRGEWSALDAGLSWKDSRAGIHRGWDWAGKVH